MVAKKSFIFIALIMLLLAACQPSSTPSPRGALVPTRIATGTATATATASNTPTATATFTPSNTPTITPTATLAIPMVEIGEAFNFSANGSLTVQDWRVRYNFVAEAGDSISVEMNTVSPRLDPLLILENDSGERLVVNDDAAEGNDNATILNFVIEANGNYTIYASRRGEEDSPYIGDYQLRFLRLPSNYYDPNTGISLLPIEINNNITGEISNESYFASYIFSGAAGQIISIEMTRVSGNLDAYLVLVNRRTQMIVAENDDDSRSDTRNAYLENISLPEDGEYIVLASRYQGADGTSTGEFALRVNSDSE